jgi:Tc5 transposase DNA-binding domain/helix-turn-helix, Psq domain
MPGKDPTAVKSRKALQQKEDDLQKALQMYLNTRDQKPPPSQDVIASHFGVARSTLSARINGRPSKLASASQRQKIYPDEEQVIVDYLREAARRGFPDTQKRCIRHANEILIARSGNKDARVGIRWLGRFLHRHHDKIRCYWSTTLTTVRGGALNRGVVDDWFELLQATITNYGIEQDCIFSMDETSCFLDKSTFKSRHIGSAGQAQQMALRNEVRETATLIPIISADGRVFKPTVIFQGKLLRGKDEWSNPLDAM